MNPGRRRSIMLSLAVGGLLALAVAIPRPRPTRAAAHGALEEPGSVISSTIPAAGMSSGAGRGVSPGKSLGATLGPAARAATPGLPFEEDFDDALRDGSLTNANWSTEEQALVLARRRARYGAFGAGPAGSDASADTHNTYSVVLGDVDVDGDLDLDLVAGNSDQPNRLVQSVLYHTGQGRAGSLQVDAGTGNVDQARLIPTAVLPPNTGVTYWLSNDGGAR